MRAAQRYLAGTVPVPLSVCGYAYDARSTPSVAPTVPPDRLAATGAPSLRFIKRWLNGPRLLRKLNAKA